MKLLILLCFWLNSDFALPATQGSLVLPQKFAPFDNAYRERGKRQQALFALRGYRELALAAPNDGDAKWRLSMACHFVGMRWATSPEEKLELFEEGRDAGKASLLLSKTCAPCHFWTAINMALYGQERGAFKTFFSLGEIEDHLQKSLAIDPTYAYGGAFRVLGAITQELPSVLGGSSDKARQYFEKAIQHAPDEPMNYLMLAKLLKETEAKREEILAIIQKALDFPFPSPERLESQEAVSELKAMLPEKSGS